MYPHYCKDPQPDPADGLCAVCGHTIELTKPCVGCAKPQTRRTESTGAEAAAWASRDWYCIPCWRKAGRPAA